MARHSAGSGVLSSSMLHVRTGRASAVANPGWCVARGDGYRGLVARRSGNNQGSHTGRFALGYLRKPSKSRVSNSDGSHGTDRHTVQLMAVQMFGTGIALPAALKGAFELPIRLDLPGALSLARSTVDCGLEGVVVHGDF